MWAIACGMCVFLLIFEIKPTYRILKVENKLKLKGRTVFEFEL